MPRNKNERVTGKIHMEVLSTAYYGPFPRQKRYFTGTFRGDVRLNGRGKRTFSGAPPRKGTVAADPMVFPLGTVLKIPGYGTGIVQDIGKAIRGHRIDVFMGHGEKGLRKAIQWGAKRVMIEVVQWGSS